MATLLLTAVGTAIGGPIGGAIGALAGQAFDHAVLLKPGRREGPRLSDLHVQTSTYGTAIPQLFGRMRVAGTVIWATDLRETAHKSGGGKGQPSVKTYSYSASFAVALSSRVAASVGRIWADGNLLRGEAGDFKTEVGAFRFHEGGGDQAVDPLIAAAQGIGVTPAHRGVAYAVFEDLALADYGNRIPSLTFELIADEAATAGVIVETLTDGAIVGSEAAVDGYAAEGDVAAALTPLVDAHGWVLRDGTALDEGVSGEAVERAALAARVNGRAVTAARLSRGGAESVPVRLSLRHYERARDYQAGVQKAVRPGPGRRERSIDVPAVVSAQRAKALAHERLAADWAGRSTLELRCGWSALEHQPGDIVQVEGSAGRWRIVEREWEAMAVRIALVAMPGGAAPVTDASPGAAISEVDALHGPTTLMLADLPVLDDATPSAPVVVAAAGGASVGWRRAALFTQASSEAEAVPAGPSAARATMGAVLTAPETGTAMLFDSVDMVEIELLSSAMVLTGADDAALLRGANMCLVGRELMQFGNVEQIGTRLYRLTRLLRGRRGTEWAMAEHDVGEPFLLLEADRLAMVPGVAVHIGESTTMLAIGIGDPTPAEAAIIVSGEALMPLPPVHLRQMSDGAGGRIFRWTRRSRAGWRWADGVDAPLAEERERYAVRLLESGVAIRSVTVDAPVWTYDAAMAAADVAAGHTGPLSLEVRQVGTHATGRATVLAVAD